MAEHFSFFDPVLDENGLRDRDYNAQQFTDYFKSLVTTGLMKGEGNELKVGTSGNNMISTVDTGVSFLSGRYYANDSLLSHTHETESLGRSRVDRIVVRLDLNIDARFVKSFIKTGVASPSPIPPSLERTDNIYEISLAQVKVVGGQTYITASNIIDERANPELCGYAGSNILPNFNDAALADLVNTVQNDIVKKVEKGKANGVASLDASGKVPSNQLNVTQPPDATTAVKGIVQLNNTVTSPLTTQAATASAAKTAYDRGTSALSTANSANNNASQAMARVAYSQIYLGDQSRATGSHAIALGSNSIVSAKNAISIGHSIDNANINRALLGAPNGGGVWDSTDYWVIQGSLSVQGNKQFEMPHPHPDKKHTHMLRHSSVESPTAGETLYRYDIEAINDYDTVEIQLPDYFRYLNKDVDVYVSPYMHFGRAFGVVVEGDILKVTCETAGTYKALVIGTRNDDNVQNWDIRGVEREVGEGWEGQTYGFEVDEFNEYIELGEAE